MTDNDSTRWTLRDLPLAARLTIAAFLMSVGIGYISALVNLHFQEAKPGNPLPDNDDVIAAYSGKAGVSQFERLLEAHPSLPFNGQGSMRAAFTTKASGLPAALKRKAKELGLAEDARKVREAVARDLEGERVALLAWARLTDKERQKQAYEEDRFELTEGLAKLPVTQRHLDEEGGRAAKVKSIIESRCAKCHKEAGTGSEAHYPLESYEQVALYLNTEAPTGKSLSKLALTTHVHLLGFSMLYGLTGLVLALTGLPAIVRVPLAPLALIAQVVDISFWWLARMEAPYGPMFATFIPISGGVVGLSLALQILLSLFDLFGKGGKAAMLLLILAGAGGAYVVKEKVVDPYMATEKTTLTAPTIPE